MRHRAGGGCECGLYHSFTDIAKINERENKPTIETLTAEVERLKVTDTIITCLCGQELEIPGGLSDDRAEKAEAEVERITLQHQAARQRIEQSEAKNEKLLACMKKAHKYGLFDSISYQILDDGIKEAGEL